MGFNVSVFKKFLLAAILIFSLGALFWHILQPNHETKTKPLTKEPQISGAETEKPKENQINLEHLYAPILLYHHIAKIEPQNSYYVSPEIFESQMNWLKENGYTVISLDRLYEAAKNQGTLPDKPVVITFDDSVLDQYKNGLPILKKFGFTATFFVKINAIGSMSMTWDMLKEMSDAGMTIGSHSINHNNMAQMDTTTLNYELTESKQILEKKLGIEIKFFSYPGGAYSDKTIEATKDAGYLASVTTRHKVFLEIKNEDSLFTLPRVHIDDEMPTFIDWVQGKNLY